MSTIESGRSTHHYDGELVLFLIGMTINRPWRPDLWLPAFLAMPRMLRELSQDPDSGLLGYRLVIEGRGPTLIQYWSSADKLYAYASNPAARHRPAWAAFNRRARRAPGAVGCGTKPIRSIARSRSMSALQRSGWRGSPPACPSHRQAIGPAIDLPAHRPPAPSGEDTAMVTSRQSRSTGRSAAAHSPAAPGVAHPPAPPPLSR